MMATKYPPVSRFLSRDQVACPGWGATDLVMGKPPVKPVLTLVVNEEEPTRVHAGLLRKRAA